MVGAIIVRSFAATHQTGLDDGDGALVSPVLSLFGPKDNSYSIEKTQKYNNLPLVP